MKTSIDINKKYTRKILLEFGAEPVSEPEHGCLKLYINGEYHVFVPLYPHNLDISPYISEHKLKDFIF